MNWLGGGAFVASLAYCAWSYIVTWRVARAATFSPESLLVDLLLFAAFAAHHSIAARAIVKNRVASLVGDSGVRVAYVWLASALLVIVCAAWQPIGTVLYQHADGLGGLHAAIQLAGLWLVYESVRRLDPLELAGIRAPSPAPLLTSGPYAWVRHPLYFGWMLMVFGAGTMTADRLAFASITTLYLLIAMPWEEASLRRHFGNAYNLYADRVRWRVIPFVY